MSTSGNPGTSGGSRVYTGTGSSSSAGASSYVDITGLSGGTKYYFTCTSYVNNLGWGSSYNVSATTQVSNIQSILQSAINNGQCQIACWNARSNIRLTAMKVAWSGHNDYSAKFTSNGNTIYIQADDWNNDNFYFVQTGPGYGYDGNQAQSGLYLKLSNDVTTSYQSTANNIATQIRNTFGSVTIKGTGYVASEISDITDNYGSISITGVQAFCIPQQSTIQGWSSNYNPSDQLIRKDAMPGWYVGIGIDKGYLHNDGGFNQIRYGSFTFNPK